MVKVEVINIRLSEKMLKWLDELVSTQLYSSRAEAIREFLREYVLEEKEKQRVWIMQGGDKD